MDTDGSIWNQNQYSQTGRLLAHLHISASSIVTFPCISDLPIRIAACQHTSAHRSRCKMAFHKLTYVPQSVARMNPQQPVERCLKVKSFVEHLNGLMQERKRSCTSFRGSRFWPRGKARGCGERVMHGWQVCRIQTPMTRRRHRTVRRLLRWRGNREHHATFTQVGDFVKRVSTHPPTV